MSVGMVQQSYNALFTQSYSNSKTKSADGSFTETIEAKTSELTSAEVAKYSKVSDKNVDKSQMDPLDYYHSLCEEFPNVIFRLSDVKESLKHDMPPYLGYQNSFNQVGNSFSSPGQTSISIDIAIIKKMQNDPDFELRIKETIKTDCSRHSMDAARLATEGTPYFSYFIQENEKGELETGMLSSANMASTEEQVREMWNMNQIEADYKNIMLSFGINDMFFEMLDKAIEKSRENAEERKEGIQHDEMQKKIIMQF